MVLLLELFLFLVRLILLFTVALGAYVLGGDFYSAVAAVNAPCAELLSVLIADVPVIFLFYGIFHRKYFWQRHKHVNVFILFISLVVAVIVTVFPTSFLSFLDHTLVNCTQPAGIVPLLTRIIITTIIVAILAFLGMDTGVWLKSISRKLQTGKEVNVSKKTKTVKKSSRKKK